MAVEDLRWWTGSEWVSIKDFNSDSLPPGTAEGQLLQWDGFGWSPAADGVVSGQLLSWDDTNKRWLPMADIGTDGSGKPIKPILPIGSEDGTVVLSSPASGTFTVSAVGTERFRIRPNGAIGLAQSASVPTTGSNNIGITQRFDLNNNGMLLSSVGYATAAANTAYGLWFQINSNAPDGTAHTGTFIPLMIGTTSVQTGTTIAEWRGINIGDQAVPDKAYGIFMTMAPRAGKERYAIFCTGSAPSRFDGQVQVPAGNPTTPSISLVGDDTGISFSTDTIMLSTAGTERLRVQSDGKVSIGNPATQGSASLLIRKTQDASSVIRMDGAAPTAAGSYYGVLSAPTVAGASNSTYSHFTASESGAGDFAVSYGFLAGNAISGTTEARGFVSSLSDGPGRWNIYADGTASNYFAGQCQFNSGSALAPAVSHAGNKNTGLFFGTDVVAISTAGTERMRVSKSGLTIPDNYQSETGGVYGVYSAINKSATNAGGTFQFLAGGDAPSQFHGQILVTSFGAATPSIANRTDPTTGVDLQPGAVMISTDGTERLRVDATGRITAADGYTPAADQDLATRKFVEDQVALGGGGTTTTADVLLTNPTRSLGRFTPPPGLATQEDANQALGDAIAERKIVLPISQVDYDALPVKDPETLYLIVT